MELHMQLEQIMESLNWHKDETDIKGVDVWFPDDKSYDGYGIMVVTDDKHADYQWRNVQAVHDLFNYQFGSYQRAMIMLEALKPIEVEG